MEKSAKTTIRLGVFVIIGILLFTVAVYLIGQKQSMFSQTFTLRSFFSNVNGLQPGNNVRFSGIDVGSVTSITIISDSLIEVRMRIKESVRSHIKKDAIASIGTDGLMGNMLVNIIPGKLSTDPVEHDGVIQTYSRIKTDDILNTLNITNDNAALLTQDLLAITHQIRSGQGTVSSIIYDSSLQNNLILTVRNLRQSTEKTNAALGTLNQILKDINQGRGTLGWLLNDTLTDDQVRQTLTKLQKTGEDLQAVGDSLKLVITKMNEGQGALAVLLNDSTMANDLKQSMRNIKEGTAAFNENMEAMKQSAFLKKYFKDQEKKKK